MLQSHLELLILPLLEKHPSLTRKTPPEIPEEYCHIFDQIENQQSQGQTSTLEYPIVYQVANAPMKVIPRPSQLFMG